MNEKLKLVDEIVMQLNETLEGIKNVLTLLTQSQAKLGGKVLDLHIRVLKLEKERE